MRFVACALCAALWCCLPSVSHAEQPAVVDCQPKTARSAESIIIPIDDAPTNGDPRLAATIELGETLCLAGTVDPNGEVKNLHLVDEASGEPTLLMFSFKELGTLKALEVKSSSAKPLRYEAAFLHGPAKIAVPTNVIDLRPRRFRRRRRDGQASS